MRRLASTFPLRQCWLIPSINAYSNASITWFQFNILMTKYSPYHRNLLYFMRLTRHNGSREPLRRHALKSSSSRIQSWLRSQITTASRLCSTSPSSHSRALASHKSLQVPQQVLCWKYMPYLSKHALTQLDSCTVGHSPYCSSGLCRHRAVWSVVPVNVRVTKANHAGERQGLPWRRRHSLAWLWRCWLFLGPSTCPFPTFFEFSPLVLLTIL